MGVFDDLPQIVADALGDLHAQEGLGFPVRITGTLDATYSTAAGTNTGGTVIDLTVTAFEDAFTAIDYASGQVQATDTAIGIPAASLAFTPEPGMSVQGVGPRAMSVITVLSSKPGAAAVYHRLQLRAA